MSLGLLPLLPSPSASPVRHGPPALTSVGSNGGGTWLQKLGASPAGQVGNSKQGNVALVRLWFLNLQCRDSRRRAPSEKGLPGLSYPLALSSSAHPPYNGTLWIGPKIHPNVPHHFLLYPKQRELPLITTNLPLWPVVGCGLGAAPPHCGGAGKLRSQSLQSSFLRAPLLPPSGHVVYFLSTQTLAFLAAGCGGTMKIQELGS